MTKGVLEMMVDIANVRTAMIKMVRNGASKFLVNNSMKFDC